MTHLGPLEVDEWAYLIAMKVTLGRLKSFIREVVEGSVPLDELKLDVSLPARPAGKPRRRRCPDCGEVVSINGQTKDGLSIGSCGDKFREGGN